jgi:hypothetical protein
MISHLLEMRKCQTNDSGQPLSMLCLPGSGIRQYSGVRCGVSATWEHLIMQGSGLISVIGSYFVAELKNTRKMKPALRELAPGT